MIIFNIRIFKLLDIDQGIHKHAIQKKEDLALLKKVFKQKGKIQH